MLDLISVMAQGTMQAFALHANDKGIKVDAEKATKAMRKIMLADWSNFQATIKDALEANMGDAMYKNIMNTFCNAWAVKALMEVC